MINTIKKSLVLAAAIAALSAIAVPSMASAANWGIVGTNHTLNVAPFTMVINNPSGVAGLGPCTGASLGTRVGSPSTLNINSATNFSCSGTGIFAGCSVAGTPTGLPWTAVAPSTSNVQINVANINLAFTGSCPFAGTTATLSGTLTGGAWNGNGAGQHAVVYSNDTGLTFTNAFWGGRPTTTTAVFQDAAFTLTLL